MPWGVEREASTVEAPGNADVEGGGGTACTSIDEGRRDRVPAKDAGAAERTSIDEGHRVHAPAADAGIEDVDAAASTSIDEGARDCARATDAGTAGIDAAALTSIDEVHHDHTQVRDAGTAGIDAAALTSIDEGLVGSAASLDAGIEDVDTDKLTCIDEGLVGSAAPIASDAGERCNATDSGGGHVRDEGRAVFGLVSLGFERKASVDTVRTLLGRGDGAPSLVELMREAIGILANARPSPGSRRVRARGADAR